MDKVTFTFELGGNSVCGQEDKPDSCRDCDDLDRCVMDMFYDAMERDTPDPLDLVKAYCDKHARNTNDATKAMAFISVSEMIERIEESPSKVIDRAKIEGWCPE